MKSFFDTSEKQKMGTTNTNRTPTLSDIAKACNVSVSTVSRALNHTGKIKEETVQKILATARELNYIQTEPAHTILPKINSNMIGFLVPNLLNPFFAELTENISKILAPKGYVLNLCVVGNSGQRVSEAIDILINSHASGMIVSAINYPECAKDFERARQYMSIVSIEGDVDHVDRIDTTDEQATYEIIEHLISNGHKKIGFIGYDYKVSILTNRLNGYRRALQNHNIDINPDYILEGEHCYESCYQMTVSLLKQPDRPTAIHCFNEFTAYAAYDAIRDLGLSVPEDVSVTGFDNVFISRIIYPQLTTVDTQNEMMAKLAMNMLFDRIENNFDGEPKQIFISHSLIKRQSVKKIN